MCGIAGFTGPRDDDVLHKMNDLISHRGPDGEGYYTEFDGVSLAHRRLSIVDIQDGYQPMWNEDNTVGIVFNGEIYNHQELRLQLIDKGHQFKTDHSDTEVLIHGYEEWGDKLPIKLNGMFAFCILDKNKKELFFARDRFGEKPLYYYYQEGRGFVFASELKALLAHPGVPQEINVLSVQKYFGYGFIPAPFSLYKNIYKLPGGYFMRLNLDTSKLQISQYWKFSIETDYQLLRRDENDLADELRSLLIQAVKRRMIADVPVGIFLSGGLDSSSILACARKNNSSSDIRTYSIGFHEKTFDESHMAKKIASLFNSIHSEKILGVEDIMSQADYVLNKLDEPLGDSSILPTSILASFAAESIKVALGGDGGDELFAGYAPFKALNFSGMYSKLMPKGAKNMIMGAINSLPASENYFSLDFKLKKTFSALSSPPAFWNPIWLSSLSLDEISEITGQKVELEELYSEANKSWNSSNSENYFDQTLEFYTRFYLQDNILTKVDRASMISSLEVRAPFLDNDVVNFAQKLPLKFKYRFRNSKFLLKKAMQNILPDEILKKPKQGFALPMTKWLKTWEPNKNNVAGLSEDFFSKKLLAHKKGKKDNRLFLWNYIALNSHVNLLNRKTF
jgi:asparagine synthase (glutamine-hydrolysing)